jgi:hypothetical protein
MLNYVRDRHIEYEFTVVRDQIPRNVLVSRCYPNLRRFSIYNERPKHRNLVRVARHSVYRQ